MAPVRYWVWLSGVSAANPRARSALVERFGDAERVFRAPSGSFRGIPGVSAREAELFERRDLQQADRILDRCREEGVAVVTLEDPAYPRRLRNIYCPPVVLYIRGRLPDVDAIPSVAVIGTRKATPYGLRMGRDIALECAACGAVVISGLTEGIDRAAAEGCLLGGGSCVGVLGTAHGRESGLLADVVRNGALVSEYPPGTRPQSRFFRERNRLSAGLSHAVCVVEAPERSGALLFAAEALEQGREIFAVPGNADSENSAGTLHLLKQGARPAARGWDILEDFAAIYPGTLHAPDAGTRLTPAPVCKPLPDSAGKEDNAVAAEAKRAESPGASTKKEIDKEKRAGYIDLQERIRDLSDDQKQIVMAIGEGSAHIDDIIEATGMSAAKVLSQLTILEIRGVIRRAAGRRVSINTVQK